MDLLQANQFGDAYHARERKDVIAKKIIRDCLLAETHHASKLGLSAHDVDSFSNKLLLKLS